MAISAYNTPSESFTRTKYIIKVTDRCNLSCKYCRFLKEDSTAVSHVLKLKLVEKLIKEACRIVPNKIELIWHGGEPLIAGKDFFNEVLEIEEKMQKEIPVRIFNSLQTNGTLIDYEWANLFIKGSFNVGVSLDGPQDIHDRNRMTRSGIGSYRNTMRGINLLRQSNIPFGVLAVVTKESLSEGEKILNFFKNNGINRLDFLPFLEQLDGGDWRNGKKLEQGDFSLFMNSIFDQWLEHNNGNIKIRYFEDIISGLFGQRPKTCKFNGSCKNYLTISSDGAIYPCDRFSNIPEWEFGNIAEIVLDDPGLLSKRNVFEKAIDERLNNCVGCNYLTVCGGGCPKYNYLNSGNFGNKNFLCSDRYNIINHIETQLVKRFPELSQFIITTPALIDLVPHSSKEVNTDPLQSSKIDQNLLIRRLLEVGIDETKCGWDDDGGWDDRWDDRGHW